MIRLSGSGVETWISPTFSHPAYLGSGIVYAFNHNRGTAPDSHVVQMYNANNVWTEVYNYWQNATATSYFGFTIHSSLTDVNTSHVRLARFSSSAEDYRVVLSWF